MEILIDGYWIPITGIDAINVDWRTQIEKNVWHRFRAFDPARLLHVEGQTQWLTLPAKDERLFPIDIFVAGPTDLTLSFWISRQAHVAIRDTIRFGAASLSIAMPQPPRRRAPLPESGPAPKLADVLPFVARRVA